MLIFAQSLSNILQIKIIRPNDTETTALGAAILAGISCNIVKNINSIKKISKNNKEFNPKINKNDISKNIKIWHNAINKLL